MKTSSFGAHIALIFAGFLILGNAAFATGDDVKFKNDPVRLENVSSRLSLTFNPPPIAGFVLAGSGQKNILMREVSGGLQQFGITDTERYAAFDVYDSTGAVIDFSSSGLGWQPNTATAMAMSSSVGAFALSAPSPADPTSYNAVSVLPLNSGNYTIEWAWTGSEPDGNIALGECYDADNPTTETATIINLSQRGNVGTGQATLIMGCVAEGPDGDTEQVILRGVGPGLQQFLAGQPAATDIDMQVYDGNSVLVAENHGWNSPITLTAVGLAEGFSVRNATAADFQSVGAFALTNGSLDSAMVLTMTVGALTSGTATITVELHTSGNPDIGLIEVYKVPYQGGLSTTGAVSDKVSTK